MNRTDIIAALRAAIALLEDGAPKAVAAPKIERRPAEPVATDDERRSFRQGRVRFCQRGTTRAGREKLRLGIEWRRPDGETVVEYFDAYEPAILSYDDPAVGTEVQVVTKPWKDTFVIVELKTTAPPMTEMPSCGFDADEIPF